MNQSAPQPDLLPGLTDPGLQSQHLFRLLLQAMSQPGTVHEVPAAIGAMPPLQPAAVAVALTLLDYETPLWLDSAADGSAAASLRFHCGCPLVDHPADAAFALVTDAAAMPPLSAFDLGSDEAPDRSSTVIVQVASLAGGTTLRLAGPGILGAIEIAPLGLPDAFVDWLADNHAAFPRGVDVILTCGAQLMALPRSSRREP